MNILMSDFLTAVKPSKLTVGDGVSFHGHDEKNFVAPFRVNSIGQLYRVFCIDRT